MAGVLFSSIEIISGLQVDARSDIDCFRYETVCMYRITEADGLARGIARVRSCCSLKRPAWYNSVSGSTSLLSRTYIRNRGCPNDFCIRREKSTIKRCPGKEEIRGFLESLSFFFDNNKNNTRSPHYRHRRRVLFYSSSTHFLCTAVSTRLCHEIFYALGGAGLVVSTCKMLQWCVVSSSSSH